MDAEGLRSTYNTYFSSGKNIWTSNDLRKTEKVARRTLEWMRDLGYKKSNLQILDVGCATGFYTEAFRLQNCHVTGLDYSEIVIEQARQKFPACEFIHMNGFEPSFNRKFDLIFCLGFSGANTHDLEFIAGWINKYMPYLSDNGFFVFGYSSDFSGKEKEGAIVNLSRMEICTLVTLINGKHRATHLFYYFRFVSKLKRLIERHIFGKTVKDYFYIFLQKN
ncbi:MAG: class I SAM-dependent methyltransferase [Chryseolinea sp.]